MRDGLDEAEAWLAAVRRGDLAAAWLVGDAILARRRAAGSCWHLPRHQQWVWDGSPLAGQRVLVRCYHGLGDTLQFARFLPQLVAACREVTVWVQPVLMPLLQRMAVPLNLLPLHDGTPAVDYDVDVEIMELGHALRTTIETLPAQVPYFTVRAEPGRCSAFNVGVVARAGEWDPGRSVPPQLMATLAEIPGIQTYNLQLGAPVPRAEDISTPDVLTLAARLLGLDLIVTGDTMMAHLAGALAIPTWTLLTAEADWRWMTGRDDSPWYPTMRLFRQSSAGEWDTVIARVRAALAVVAG